MKFHMTLFLCIALPFLFCACCSASPSNCGLTCKLDKSSGMVHLTYDKSEIISGQFFVLKGSRWIPLKEAGSSLLQEEPGISQAGSFVLMKENLKKAVSVSGKEMVTQTMTFKPSEKGERILFRGNILTSEQGFPCEEYPEESQKQFPIIRNTVGLPSTNLRNRAVYDRKWDWVLAARDTGDSSVRILPVKTGSYDFTVSGESIQLEFKPHFYQYHKNLTWFEPWTYNVWQKSVCGWCSWWAYRTSIDEKTVSEIADVFQNKFKDFGLDTIQIDDGYQIGYGGTPKDWATTNSERFPGGLQNLEKIIESRGLKPALWVNVHFGDETTIKEHPDWFVKNPDGSIHKGPWIDYGLDGSNKEALNQIVKPIYANLKHQGWQYVKVDTLRHLLYDSYYPCRSEFTKKGITPEEAYRDYLKTIRTELGRDTYMLACWGILPEVIGIVDGCRLGADGFGRTGLTQYNSWNNIVWRNDPDHMDITPQGEEWIRPVTVTMSGAQMLLTDKVAVYSDDTKIEGTKRCAPVLFTIPGQLYDYDPCKTDLLIQGVRNQNGGSGQGPIDADQEGRFCSHWLMEINRPFGSWDILARMDWKDLPEETISFSDLGLNPNRDYLVFEYQSKKFLGSFKGSFSISAQKAKDVQIFAIREKLAGPQILATSRHITCGGPDLLDLKTTNNQISGVSQLVKNDPYKIYFYLPEGSRLGEVKVEGAKLISQKTEGQMRIIELQSEQNKKITWNVLF